MEITANKVLASAANRGIDALNSRGEAVPPILFAIANMGPLNTKELQVWRRELTSAETDENLVLFEALGGRVAKGFLRQFAPAQETVANKKSKVTKSDGPNNSSST